MKRSRAEEAMAPLARSTGADLLERRERDLALASAYNGGQNLTQIDDKSLKKLLTSLEKKVNENLELRSKYPNDPEKFMHSEVDLDIEVRNLQSLATTPHLYPALVRYEATALLLPLLQHVNKSITVTTIQTISELIEVEEVEFATEFTSDLLRNNVTDLLEEALYKCTNEKGDDEEREIVSSILSVIECLVDHQSSVAESLQEKKARGSVLHWIVNRVGVDHANDSNRTLSSEILAIMLQNSDRNKKIMVHELNGIEVLLQAIASFRKVDPVDSEEEEYLENLFDALCACAMLEENKEELSKAEALELMVVMMKKRPAARLPAMKVCNFALTACGLLCENFVSAGGLGLLFAFFMGKGSSKKTKAFEMQELAISIIANLLAFLGAGPKRNRVLAKFAEQDCEKLDRLVELWNEYSEKLGKATDDLAGDDDEEYLELLDSGLYVLQQLALVKAFLWASGDVGIQKRLVFVMEQYGHSLKDISRVLKRQFGFMYNDSETKNTVSEGGEEAQKNKLKKLIDIIEYNYDE